MALGVGRVGLADGLSAAAGGASFVAAARGLAEVGRPALRGDDGASDAPVVEATVEPLGVFVGRLVMIRPCVSRVGLDGGRRARPFACRIHGI